jgi:TRAP-type C4-dicarboxylate transport system substrate-binding protein
MKKVLLVLVSLTLGLALLIPACQPAAEPAPPTTEAEPIELKAITALPDFLDDIVEYMTIYDEIERLTDGQVVIEYVGAQEVFGAFDMGAATEKGLIDMAMTFGAGYEVLVPDATILRVSELPLEEERAEGLYDALQEHFNDAGLYFLGRSDNFPTENRFLFYFITVEPIETLADMEGLRIATEDVLVYSLPRMGMEPILVGDEEIYTALETGMVDGMITTIDQVGYWGGSEVLNYWLDHAFRRSAAITMFNLDSWNSISEDNQDIIKEIQIDREQYWAEPLWDLVTIEKDLLLEEGMQSTTLSSAEEEEFLTMVWDYEREEYLKINPSTGPRLLEIASYPLGD